MTDNIFVKAVIAASTNPEITQTFTTLLEEFVNLDKFQDNPTEIVQSLLAEYNEKRLFQYFRNIELELERFLQAISARYSEKSIWMEKVSNILEWMKKMGKTRKECYDEMMVKGNMPIKLFVLEEEALNCPDESCWVYWYVHKMTNEWNECEFNKAYQRAMIDRIAEIDNLSTPGLFRKVVEEDGQYRGDNSPFFKLFSGKVERDFANNTMTVIE